MARHRQRHQRRGQHGVSRAHHRQEVAVADAVANHAEHRRHQRADITKRSEHREQQYRSGLDQHVPAEDQRLHLERPRGEQIGGPLKTIISDAEWCERGRPRGPAQVSMPRFIAFHPARFLIVAAVSIASVSGRFKLPLPQYRVAKPGVDGLLRLISVQPRMDSRFRCCSVSTPSAVVVMSLAADAGA